MNIPPEFENSLIQENVTLRACVEGLKAERDRYLKGLSHILELRNVCGYTLLDAQIIASMTVNPQDYSRAALEGQGLAVRPEPSKP